jgi:hypothetical protein
MAAALGHTPVLEKICIFRWRRLCKTHCNFILARIQCIDEFVSDRTTVIRLYTTLTKLRNYFCSTFPDFCFASPKIQYTFERGIAQRTSSLLNFIVSGFTYEATYPKMSSDLQRRLKIQIVNWKILLLSLIWSVILRERFTPQGSVSIETILASF